MKKIIFFCLSILIFACTDDESVQNSDNPDDNGNNNPSSEINATNFQNTIDENPINNSNIGIISASSDLPLTFSIISQNPVNSMSIISSSGLLKVQDNSLFDYETNPTITANIKIENDATSINVTATVNLNDIYECDITSLTFTEEQSSSNFSERIGHKIIIFNNKYLSYGGSNNPNTNVSNEIWSSTNGINWNLETSNPTYQFLRGRVPVVYLNKVWLIGKGLNNSTEIWSSNDGIVFTEQNITNSSFNNYGRSNHQLLVFNNTLFMIGGKIDGIYTNDVSSTTDGIIWNSITTSGSSFSPGRHNHISLIFDNKIWVIGGENPINQGDFNDAWSSSDGINWVLESEDGFKFSKRSSHQVVSYNNKLWLWGGSSDLGTGGFNRYRDIWTSCDGKRWFQVDNYVNPSSNKFPTRVTGAQSIVTANKILSIGGYNGTAYEPIWEFEE